MLELRPVCEHCNKSLPPASVDAMMCSYECTFCAECVETVLKNVCPNCGGGFMFRPFRPREILAKDPAVTKAIHKPINAIQFSEMLKKYERTKPEDR